MREILESLLNEDNHITALNDQFTANLLSVEEFCKSVKILRSNMKEYLHACAVIVFYCYSFYV